MNEKLKTLKDIKTEQDKRIKIYLKKGIITKKDLKQHKYPHFITIEALKQEAIKWIKELEKYDNNEESYCLKCNKKADYSEKCNKHWNKYVLVISDPYEPHGPKEAIIWIKWFFNIEEKELK